mmetsp:Transcript_12480/g.12566  ORF Transcript_12480/g.12566 Transcript_12480/m.12566 type:complete len:97 (+) Transcript_12480:235-525(+)
MYTLLYNTETHRKVKAYPLSCPSYIHYFQLINEILKQKAPLRLALVNVNCMRSSLPHTLNSLTHATSTSHISTRRTLWHLTDGHMISLLADEKFKS